MGVRISELAQRSGVSVPTIKYYLRVGLLPSGATTAHNQATYGDTHLRRLRLIRALTDIGGLTVMATRDVLALIDDAGTTGRDLLAAIAAAGTAARRGTLDSVVRAATLDDMATLVTERGWRVAPDARALDRLTEVFVAARLLEVKELPDILDDYAGAAARLAECDLEVTRALAAMVDAAVSDEQRVLLMERMAIVAVLGRTMLTVLHSLARESALSRLFVDEHPDERVGREP